MERIERQILQALATGGKSVYELIHRQDASLKEFLSVMHKLQGDLIYMENGKAGLTAKGVEVCRRLSIRPLRELSCTACEGTGYAVAEDFAEVLEKLKRIARSRPEALEKYDQGYMSLSGVVRRAEFIYERGDLAGTKIFVLGDDDLFSIAASLTRLPREVHVADIDERLVSFINQAAEEHGLQVKAEVYDVQRPLPNSLSRRFDVYVTDPVETLPGIRLFLSRAAASLHGKGSSGYFGLTTLEASREKWYRIQMMLLDMGLVITDIRRRFNVYPQEDKNFFRFQDKLPIVRHLGTEVDYDWYTSSFIRVEAVEDLRPSVTGEEILDEKVYRDDESLATPAASFEG
jgi:hypothetical protein